MPLRQHRRHPLPIHLLRIYQLPILPNKPPPFDPIAYSRLPLPHPIPINPQQHIIPTHHPLPHLPCLRPLRLKRPVFKPVASLPTHVVMRILVFIEELHGDFGGREGEEFFAEAVVKFFLPLSC